MAEKKHFPHLKTSVPLLQIKISSCAEFLIKAVLVEYVVTLISTIFYSYRTANLAFVNHNKALHKIFRVIQIDL